MSLYFIQDKPEAPGQPQIEEMYAQSADLSWTAPANDGGAPITHYVVEYKKKGQAKWQVWYLVYVICMSYNCSV